MIFKTDITNLKTDIVEKVGQKIIVKGSAGKSKTFEKEATIEKAYGDFFCVKYKENSNNETYRYTDVLTKNIELDIFDGNTYNPLEVPEIEFKKKKISAI